MKKVFVILMLVSVSVWAGYTYEITSSSEYIWDLTLEDSETLLMTGGGGDNFTGKNNSTLYIQNTSSPVVRGESGIVDLTLVDNCQLNLSGGSIAHISIGDDATAILSGGQINQIWGYYFFPANPERITIYCQPGWTYQNGYLSGLWNDDTTFNIQLVTKSGSDVFSNMTIIPEPASLLLLAVGSLLICKK